MKKIYSVTFLLVLSLTVVSCKKEKVEGPQGPQGDGALMKQGYISGNLRGKTQAGDSIKETFRYEYFTSYDQSQFHSDINGDTQKPYYIVSIQRRSANNEECYFAFDSDYVDSLEGPDWYYTSFEFHYQKDLGNGKFLKFEDTYYPKALPEQNTGSRLDFSSTNSTFSYSNYSFNPSTGQLKFDYKINFSWDENTSENPAILTGTVDVNLKQPVMRQGYFLEE